MPRPAPFRSAFIAFALCAMDNSSLVAQTVDEQVIEAINANRLFRLLDRADSNFRPRFRAFLEKTIATASTRAEAQAAGVAWGRQEMTPYLTKFLPAASDSTLLAYVETFTGYLGHLAETNPRACANLLFGGIPDVPFTATPPEFESKLLSATEQVIAEGLERPGAVIDTATATVLLPEILEEFRDQHGDSGMADLARLADPADARTEPAKSCQATVRLYRVAFDLPPESAVTLLRFLLSAR